MSLNQRTVYVVFATALLAVLAVPQAMAQLAADELQKDQTFEAIMAAVDVSQPQAMGIAKIILPSPRFFPLNRFAYIRVEADGLIPGATHAIHLHGVRTDANNTLNNGCYGGDPVIVNLRSLVGDANGHGVSVTRIILDASNNLVQDANGARTVAAGNAINRTNLTRWYVQFHIPAGTPGAGSPMACGEITLSGFDRGAAYQ